MTTLVLLHGAWHGAWCWELFGVEARALGLETIAIDLPGGAADAGAHAQVEFVAAAVRDVVGLDDVVVVPHSLAGLVAPMVADRIGARGVVNLAALTPEVGVSGLAQARALPDIYTEPYRTAPMTRNPDTSTSVPIDVARELLFHDVDVDRAGWAFARLRPQFWGSWLDPCPIESWPTIRYAHVACADVRVLGAEGMVDGARRTQAPLTWIPGGHTAMLARPSESAAAVAAAIDAW